MKTIINKTLIPKVTTERTKNIIFEKDYITGEELKKRMRPRISAIFNKK